MTNHKIGLSQAQQRRNHRHVIWRVAIKRARFKMDYRGPGWNPNTNRIVMVLRWIC